MFFTRGARHDANDGGGWLVPGLVALPTDSDKTGKEVENNFPKALDYKILM